MIGTGLLELLHRGDVISPFVWALDPCERIDALRGPRELWKAGTPH